MERGDGLEVMLAEVLDESEVGRSAWLTGEHVGAKTEVEREWMMPQTFEEKRKQALAALGAAAQKSYSRKRVKESASALVASLRTEIEELRAKGATWDQVTEVLGPIIGATKATIRMAYSSVSKGASAEARPKASRKRKPTSAPKAANATQPVARASVREKVKDDVLADSSGDARTYRSTESDFPQNPTEDVFS
jgi:hypothetical protein